MSVNTAWEEGELKAARKRRRRLPRMSEDQIQIAVVECLQSMAWPDAVFAHVPNGGLRTKIQAARFKAMGVLAGWPDLEIRWRGQSYFLELKTIDGIVEPEQAAVHRRLAATGAEVAVAYGLDAALAQLARWGLLRGSVQV